MTSRSANAASTPNHADFPVQALVAPQPGVTSSEPPTPPEESESSMQRDGKWRSRYLAAKDMVQSNLGLLLVTGSQAFFSMMNVAVKKLNSIDPPVSTFELIAVRMFITYVFSMGYMSYARIPDPWFGPKGVRLWLAFRGFSGFFGLLGIYYSLQYLSLSDATVLTFLAPLCTGISGAVFLKENYSKKQAFASIFSLFGVVLIARPVFLFGKSHSLNPLPIDVGIDKTGLDDSEKGTPEQRLVAVGVALIGVLGSTGAYTSITAIGKRAHPLHAMTSFSFQCVVVAVTAMIVQRTPVVIPTQIEWLLLLVMIGVFGFVAQVLLTMGLQRETAGRGTIAVYTQVVFATILERIFFRTAPSILSVIGTLIIITAALYVAVTKEQVTKTKRNVRLSGIPEGALEEGLLDRLLEDNDDASVKGTLQAKLTSEADVRQKQLGVKEVEDEFEETSALPSPRGSLEVRDI